MVLLAKVTVPSLPVRTPISGFVVNNLISSEKPDSNSNCSRHSNHDGHTLESVTSRPKYGIFPLVHPILAVKQ